MTIFDTFTEAYIAVLTDVYQNGTLIEAMSLDDMKDESDPLYKKDNFYYNKQASKEILNYSFTIRYPMKDQVLTTKSDKHNKIISAYIEEETKLFDSGDIYNMGKISKIWDLIANPDGSINANYGYMVYHLKDAGNYAFDPATGFLSQWEWAKSRLILDRNTLQAYCHFNRTKDQWRGNLDQPCTMYIQFIIRANKLNLISSMRSNDVVYGMPYNISYFIKLLQRMCSELSTLDKFKDLTIGTYTHNTTSAHYYLRNESRVKSMIGLDED